MTVRLAVLGTVDLADADGTVVLAVLAQPKRLALLVYLAVARPAGFHRRDRLLALLWPEFDESAGRAALSRAVHHLRRAIGADAITSRGDQEIAVDRLLVTSDLCDLGEALERGDAMAALALYRGDLLEGFHVDGSAEFDSWLEQERLRLRAAVVTSASDACHAAERSGNLAVAMSFARRASELSPYSESAMLDLMRVSEAFGSRSDALFAYEAFVTRFKADLEADPGPELYAAAERIRTEPARLAPSRPAGDHVLAFQRPSQLRYGRSAPTRGSDSAEPALRLVPVEEEEEHTADIVVEPKPPSSWRRFVPWALSTVAMVVLITIVLNGRSVAVPPIVRFTLAIAVQNPPTTFGPAIALSPDGSELVYVGWSDGRPNLFLRRLDQATPRMLAGTGDGQAPFFSPDGQWVGYWAHGQLRKVSVNDGSSARIADVWWVGGATWLTDAKIILGKTPGNPRLSVVDAAGGTPAPLSLSSYGEHPIALPGARFFLFIGNRGLSLGTLGDSAATPLGVQGTPVGVLDDAVIYVRADGALMALPVDLRGRRATAPPVQLLNGDLVLSAALANDGTLVYIRRLNGTRAMVVDLAGHATTPVLEDSGGLAFPAVSPNGQRVAFTVPSAVGYSVSVYDIPSKTLSRLVFGRSERPSWSADGKWVGFTGTEPSLTAADSVPHYAQTRPYRIAADGSGSMDTLSRAISDLDAGIREVTFSPDGRFAVIRNDAHKTKRDLWLIPLGPRGATGSPVPLEVTPADELMARVSPDSHHLTFISDASGKYEVYVRPFPTSGPVVQISDGGGTEPVWSSDGRGIFYRANGKMVLAMLSNSPLVRVLDRKELFRGDQYLASDVHPQYDVMPDGHRLMMLQAFQPVGDQAQAVVVVQGWVRELRRQMAVAARGAGR